MGKTLYLTLLCKKLEIIYEKYLEYILNYYWEHYGNRAIEDRMREDFVEDTSKEGLGLRKKWNTFIIKSLLKIQLGDRDFVNVYAVLNFNCSTAVYHISDTVLKGPP